MVNRPRLTLAIAVALAVSVSAIAQKCDRQVTKIAHFDDLDREVRQAREQTLPPAADSSVAVILALD